MRTRDDATSPLPTDTADGADDGWFGQAALGLESAPPLAPGTTLTVFSNGGGQDSAAIRELLFRDPDFRARYAPGRLIAVMADTGDEHAPTLDEVRRTAIRCANEGVDFVHLTADMGYHGLGWTSLPAQWERNHTVGTVGFRSTCSIRLKLDPIYRWLAAYVQREYGLPRGRTIHSPLVQFAARYGKIRVLIGFAAGEESRADPLRRDGTPKAQSDWMRLAVEKAYPLIDRGMDRAACQAYVAAVGEVVPPPSLCRRCHWKSPRGLLLLKRTEPAVWAEWVEAERRKFVKFADKGDKNIGVRGDTRSLEEHMADIEAEFGHLSTEDLAAWEFHHGHCVATAA